MDRLKKDGIDGMLYSSYTIDDGNTFAHINIARNAECMAKLNEVDEFNAFRKALKESEPVSPPKSIDLNPVGAEFEI